jgi:outer membrane protein TolC
MRNSLLPLRACAFFVALLLAAPHAAGEERLELALGEAVASALSRNLSVEEERLLQRIGEAGVMEAQGEFDPVFRAGVSAADRKEPSITTIVSPRQETVDYEASLSGKVSTGTEYDLRLQGQRAELGATPFLLINPYNSSELVITITQPLLKGFGREVQESRVRSAEADLAADRLRAEHHAMDLISETAGAYWDLYFARGNLEAADISLRLAQSTLEEVEAKIKAGTLAPVEIYKAEAEAAVREERYLSARKGVFDAEDTLRAIMNTTAWHGEVVPVEKPPEPVEPPALDGVLADALENRRDLMQARSELRGRELMEKYYRDQTRPELNLVGSAGTGGLDRESGEALEGAASGDFYSWEIGVALEIPVGNRAQRGRYLRAKYETGLSELRIRELRQEITVEVREALRALELARESVRASGRSKRASEKRLEAEEERFRLGMATLNDVLRFQEEYADAISSEKRAIADYASNSVRLRRASGTLISPTLMRPLAP